MNFPFYIARRYLFAKKSQTAVNVLTLVAVTGVCVGTIALVIVLSVFNGFERLILSLFNSFNPDIEITVAEGKTFNFGEFPAEEIRRIPGVLYLGEVLEETALLTYRDRQHIIKLRGVDDNYRYITRLDTMIREGEFNLVDGDMEQIILGQGVAYMINANIWDYLTPLNLYIPRRGNVSLMNPTSAFSASSVYASGVFSVQAEFDADYVIAPISLVRYLTQHESEVTAAMLAIDPTANVNQIQKQIMQIIGDRFVVKNRLQQEEFLYKVMRSEKWAIFLILSFILVIAAFNITGSLTMLILEKRKDIGTIWKLGAQIKTINQIFLYEGILISSGGALAGLVLGTVICWVQIEFGVIGIQAQGTFIIDAYPVHINPFDLILVFVTVNAIGIGASMLPLQKIKSLLTDSTH